MGMRPVTVVVNDAQATSDPIPVNWRMAPFELGIQVDVTGTVEVDGQYTLDDIRVPGWSASSALWNTMPAPFDGVSADAAGKFAIPCTAIRFHRVSGTGGASIRVVSAGK